MHILSQGLREKDVCRSGIVTTGTINVLSLISDRGDGNHKMAVTHFAASHDFVACVQLSTRNHVVERVEQNSWNRR